MKSAYDILLERGFIEQTTHEEEIIDLFKKEKITFYIGFDATADSLTAGHFVTVMAMAHLQKAGHQPIALIGGGTTLIGDPSGRTDMRKMMTRKDIDYNANRFKEQLSKFIDFKDDKAIMANNADWLCELNYLDFIRDIGVHFSVNRMLSADCYKTRYEKGLTFLEFNYMIMQSYDFLVLNNKYNCIMQLGGNDQWSNIIGGVELIRRKENKPAYGMTFKLLTTSDGRKMGKTQSGAVWLDPNKTSPYEFYQYWRNTEDSKVEECLSLLTFLPIEKVKELGSLKGSEINRAKEILAFEITKIVHGEGEAIKAESAAKALFSGGNQEGSIPTTTISTEEFAEGIDIIELMQRADLIKTRSEGRRLIEQGGIRINDIQEKDFNRKILLEDFNKNELMIKKGKKVYHRINIK